MRKSTIPTLLAIILLVAATFAIIFTIKEFQLIKSNAASNFEPLDLKITNIKDTSFTVSWLTETPTIGLVIYGNDQIQSSETKASSNSITHFVTIQNLNPASSYSFKINSNGQIFDNLSSLWTVQTKNSLGGTESTIVSGQILNKTSLPDQNSLVYVDTNQGIYSTMVAISGNWIVSLPALPDTTILQILVEKSPSEVASAKIDLKSANPTPPITLGNSYDFRNEGSKPQTDTPNVLLQLP